MFGLIASRSRWRDRSLGVKGLVVVAVPASVVVFVAASFVMAQRATRQANASVRHTFEVRDAIGSVLQDLVDAETGVRGFVLTGESGFLDPYTAALERLPQDLARLDALATGDDVQRRRAQELRLLVGRRLAILDQVRALPPSTSGELTPDAVHLLEEGKAVGDQIRAQLGAMDADEQENLADRRRREDEASRLAMLAAFLGLPLAFGGGGVGAYLFATGVARRVRRVEENAARLARGEPLAEPPQGADEVGQLGRALVDTATVLTAQREELERMHQELRALAIEDDLTGLLNRRGFFPLAEHHLRLADRTLEPTVLLFADVDGLKAVNDRFGHAEGSRLIVACAEVLREATRQSDVLARIGGDEFCVLLPGPRAPEAERTVLDRIDRLIAGRNAAGAWPFQLSLSIGTATYDPVEAIDLDELIRRADARMYEQKRARRR